MTDRMTFEELQPILENRLNSSWEERPPVGLLSSAVTVPLMELPDGVNLLYIRRANTISDHGDQVSFPGGMRDPGDRDLLATAAREAVEEVGLEMGSCTVYGSLDPVSTLGKYRIQPFVCRWPGRQYAVTSPEEVARIFTVPLGFLMQADSERMTRVIAGGETLTVPAWVFDREVIWGATRRITLDLVRRLRSALKTEGL
jgi:8-oxo-dGTP pyrophosphatase MutT (NUDIX family)